MPGSRSEGASGNLTESPLLLSEGKPFSFPAVKQLVGFSREAGGVAHRESGEVILEQPVGRGFVKPMINNKCLW